MTIKRTFATYTILASIVMVAISGTTQNVHAQIMAPDGAPPDANILLVELIDGSSSIDSTQFGQQTAGLAAGLQATYTALFGTGNDLFGRSHVIVVQFASIAVTECSVEIINQAALTVLLNCINNITQLTAPNATCISCGFAQADAAAAAGSVLAKFKDTDPNNARQIYDLITDGTPFPESLADAIQGRDNSVATGVDRIVNLGITPTANTAILAQLVHPENPPVIVVQAPFDENDLPSNDPEFPDGYVVFSPTFAGFPEAIEFKLIGILEECPPGTFLPPGGTIIPDDCVPLVGGEFLPIDSAALLIAGMSANLSLIVPIAAGIAGAGAYLIRSRMSKD